MVLSEEDKLLLNGELFYFLRTYIRNKKSEAEIIEKIEELLKDGADINACDKNDSNNTVLHIAVHKEKKEIVTYLLNKGFSIQDKRRLLNLASQNNTPVGKEIADILSKQPATCSDAPCGSENETKLRKESNHSIVEATGHTSTTTHVDNTQYTYSKRAGTSGISGQFYETKLLSLIFHRALHDKETKEFYLAVNINDIGDFDDVCFRYNNVSCFMQTKHRENIDKAKLTVASARSNAGKLGTYFDSFLKIRRKFSPNSTDPMFLGKFEEVDCYFIFYTPLKESFDRKLKESKPMCSKLYDIINTRGKENEGRINTDLFQFDFEERDLDYLTTFIKREHLKTLAKTFLGYILSRNKLEAMMAGDLIKIYHPAMGQNVILVTREPNSDIHIGKFREEFFDCENINLMLLRDTFCNEIIYSHSGKVTISKDELKLKLQDIARSPSAETISELIGSPLKFDDSNDKLWLDVDKLPKNSYKQDEVQQIKLSLQKVQVTKRMITEAVYIAGKKKLQSLTFQLPQTFGNIDIIINKKKNVSRLHVLAKKFHELIEYYSEINKNQEIKILDISCDVVGPGKILETSHLNSNGIGGAVGNLLDFDTKTELFTFKDKKELSDNALNLHDKIKELVNEDLSKYKFKVLVDGFPRTSFDIYKYDKNLGSQFLSKLWFFTNQAQEEAVEATIKREINMYYNADKQRNQFLFHVHSDAIFLRFHDKMQKWWKAKSAQYLTKNTNIYEEAKKGIVDSPLLTVLSVMFIRRSKEFGLEFSKHAKDTVVLQEYNNCNKNVIINIISDAVVLSASKIMQYNEYHSNYTYINLDYVHILPQYDYKIMIEELGVLKNVLVIIIESLLDEKLQDTLLDILNNFSKSLSVDKQIIIITTVILPAAFQSFNNFEFVNFKDDNVNLADLTPQSRKHILETCQIIYQGQIIEVTKVVEEDSMELINAKLLWSLLNKEKFEIGHAIECQKYNEIMNYYIERDLEYDGEMFTVQTLYDLDNQVVLISSKPCMGKSILITHLSLETKKVNPKLWIIIIDMSSYAKDLEAFKNRNPRTLFTFLAKIALKNADEIEKISFIEIDNETVAISSEGHISFELQLFIHFYNNGNIIFLFDGFDKIFPQYTNEALTLFTELEQANKRMWITSDCYVIKVLQERFGLPYSLQRLNTTQQKNFLERFWSTNLQLEKLNYEQFSNVILFFEYILKNFDSKIDIMDDFDARHKLPFLSVSLHVIYLSILDHFKHESHSLSPHYFQEKFKKEFNLDSYTGMDRYLQNCAEDESLQLAGTPLHLYIAANYFAFQITDRFDLHFDTDMIRHQSNIYINTLTCYERFLKSNMKIICEIENKTAILENQEKQRDDFFEKHKKLALYAIYKEKDISKILTPSEIIEVKKTIAMIESGEIKTDLIDCVVDGIPRFGHLLFAEYFIVETLANLLNRVKRGDFCDVNMNSFWDFTVNVVLVTGPASLRNAFEYKLKYDPDLVEIASNDYNGKIIFNLLLKSNNDEDPITQHNAINTVAGEGLITITNFLLSSIRNNVDNDSANRVMAVLQGSGQILDALDPSRSMVSEDIVRYIQNFSGETLIRVLNLNEVNHELNDTITTKVVEPVKQFMNQVIQWSDNNENLVTLVDELPRHLPDFIRRLFDAS